jgi:hypothetical protein
LELAQTFFRPLFAERTLNKLFSIPVYCLSIKAVKISSYFINLQAKGIYYWLEENKTAFS